MRIVPLTSRRIQVGDKIHRLTLIGEPFYLRGRQTVVCACDCGAITVVRVGRLFQEKEPTRSCGCHSREHSTSHGQTDSRINRIWRAMKTRCSNPRTVGYANYGGRGIAVCREWKESFVAFRDWSIANGYADTMEIDRKDNDGNYEPSNCRWVTHKKNANNKRNNCIVTAFGETKPLGEWMRDPRCVVGRIMTLWQRLYKCKWEAEKAITEPVLMRQRVPRCGSAAQCSAPL